MGDTIHLNQVKANSSHGCISSFFWKLSKIGNGCFHSSLCLQFILAWICISWAWQRRVPWNLYKARSMRRSFQELYYPPPCPDLLTTHRYFLFYSERFFEFKPREEIEWLDTNQSEISMLTLFAQSPQINCGLPEMEIASSLLVVWLEMSFLLFKMYLKLI